MKNRYKRKDGKVYIRAIGKGEAYVFVIDEEDFEKVDEFPGTWYIEIPNTGSKRVRIHTKRGTLSLSRIILETKTQVRYINGDSLNATRENLKIKGDCIDTRKQKTR